jgi:pantothenate kinase
MHPPTIPLAALETWVRDLVDSTEGRVLLGLAGEPGCGKSTVSYGLAAQLSCPIVGMDGFHLAMDVVERRGLVHVKGAPHTFDVGGFIALLERLARRPPEPVIWAPRYDRAIRNPIGSAVPVEADDGLVIVEGNYLLLEEEPWDRIAGLLTAVVYLDVDRDIRIARLVDRHIAFGKPPDVAREFVMRSDEANARLVAATRSRADLVVIGA